MFLSRSLFTATSRSAGRSIVSSSTLFSGPASSMFGMAQLRLFSTEPEEGHGIGRDGIRNKLFALNVPFNLEWHDLKKELSDDEVQCTYARVMLNNEGRSRGLAILEYATAEQAALALEKFNNVELSGRQVTIDWAQPRTGLRTGSRTPISDEERAKNIFISNMPFDATDEEIASFFQDDLGLTFTQLALTGRGGCLMSFDTAEAAAAALPKFEDEPEADRYEPGKTVPRSPTKEAEETLGNAVKDGRIKLPPLYV